ncbi:hypothetical protein N7463_010108, partial [Penicillium fimorum]
FFSNCTVTRDECDQTAAEIAGEAVKPVQLQGAFSYTVATGNLLVQFHVSDSLFDTKILGLAREIYGNIVPASINKGFIGPSPSLAVYVMDMIPGITYIEAPVIKLQYASWHEQTVSDFARFFANSWVNRPTEPYVPEHSLVDLQDQLDLLLQQLPSRFAEVISKLREELPTIFTPTYPLVLTHYDLCGMNIIVNPEAGGITGVVYWAEAMVLPFDIPLWGFYNMLGIMNSSGWISNDDKHAMKIAERVGLVIRFGFTWKDGAERPVNEQDSSIRYLDAFLHRL